MAEMNGVSREDQDSWALGSHAKAVVARDAGLLADEIVAVSSAVSAGAICGRLLDTRSTHFSRLLDSFWWSNDGQSRSILTSSSVRV